MLLEFDYTPLLRFKNLLFKQQLHKKKLFQCLINKWVSKFLFFINTVVMFR